MSWLISTLATAVILALVHAQLPSKVTTDFSNASLSYSVGGKAACVAGIVQIPGLFPLPVWDHSLRLRLRFYSNLPLSYS